MNKETKELLIEGLDCLLHQLKSIAIDSLEADEADITTLKKIIKIQELKESLDSKETAG